jgi:AraC-like DNA-binding protein
VTVHRPNAARGASGDTQRLLEAAAALAPGDGGERVRLEQFAGLYLDWILAQRGMSRRTADRREKTSLMLHCLVGARSLGDALRLYERFARQLWQDRWLARVSETGDRVELAFGTPLKPGVTGLVDDLWTLARAASELEWLIQGELADLTGFVRPQALLDPALSALFFGHPVTYAGDRLALSLPRSQLERRVVARAETIEQFCIGLPLSTLAPEARRRSTAPLVAELLRRRAAQGDGEALSLESVAALLGHSPTTLRRSLSAEGAGFRSLKEAVLGDLARDWLANSDLTVEAIAARLGYSDGFSFRRWFRRRCGCAPSTFRQRRFAGPDGG